MSAFPNNLFAGERFSVVGLGRNGLPAATALAAMGATVTAWDDKAEARDAAVLESLYAATNGDGWDNTTGWKNLLK